MEVGAWCAQADRGCRARLVKRAERIVVADVLGDVGREQRLSLATLDKSPHPVDRGCARRTNVWHQFEHMVAAVDAQRVAVDKICRGIKDVQPGPHRISRAGLSRMHRDSSLLVLDVNASGRGRVAERAGDLVDSVPVAINHVCRAGCEAWSFHFEAVQADVKHVAPEVCSRTNVIGAPSADDAKRRGATLAQCEEHVAH